MVDVARRAERQRREAHRDQVDVRIRQRAAVEQAHAVGDAREDGRIARPQARRVGVGVAGQRDREGGQIVQRERAAAHPGDALDDRAAGPLRKPLRSGAHDLERLRGGAQHRQLGAGANRIAVDVEGGLERRQAQLVDAQRATERMAPDALERRDAARDDAGLGSAQELVAREADGIGAGRE